MTFPRNPGSAQYPQHCIRVPLTRTDPLSGGLRTRCFEKESLGKFAALSVSWCVSDDVKACRPSPGWSETLRRGLLSIEIRLGPYGELPRAINNHLLTQAVLIDESRVKIRVPALCIVLDQIFAKYLQTRSHDGEEKKSRPREASRYRSR